MIFTVDRIQFVKNKLIVFEFFNIDREQCNEDFINDKVNALKIFLGKGIDKLYYIKYKNDYSFFEIEENSKVTQLTYEGFTKWFVDINGQENNERSNSKVLGAARETNVDNYVSTILNNLYQNDYPNIDFTVDDNGLQLVKDVLSREQIPTFGVDFDLFCSTTGLVFEFLKRDSRYVTNLTAHPCRYTKNKHKFVTLWKAAKEVSLDEVRLILINYSDNQQEHLGVIEIKDFDEEMDNDKMSLNEVGYDMENVENLVELLRRFDTCYQNGFDFLQTFPKQTRDANFFKNVYDQDFKKKQKKWNCFDIGRTYN